MITVEKLELFKSALILLEHFKECQKQNDAFVFYRGGRIFIEDIEIKTWGINVKVLEKVYSVLNISEGYLCPKNLQNSSIEFCKQFREDFKLYEKIEY